MCARLLACPLCSQPSFSTLDALRAGLVSVATRPLMCPVCNEVLVGIDKLTIHLFGHTINLNDNSIQLLKPTDINVDSNHTNIQHVQVKSTYDWNILHKKIVDTGQEYDKKDKSNNCCSIQHAAQSFCAISNSRNKQVKIQNQNLFDESSQVVHLSEPIGQNMNTSELQYTKENNRSFLELQPDSSEVISKTSKTSSLEDHYKNNNVQDENLQTRQMNKLEDIWIENLSQVCNQHSTTQKELLSCSTETPQMILNQTETNNNQHNSKNSSVVVFPHIISMSENENVLIPEKNNKQRLDDHKETITLSNIEVKYQSMNSKEVVSNLKPIKTLVSKEKTERCNVCGFHFPDHNILVLHKQLIHMIDEKNLNNVSDNLLKSYSCHLCSKVFKMRGSLMIHMRVAHIGHNWGFLSKDGDTSMGLNNNGYNCPTCGKNFRKEQHVIQHLKTHEGKQWECDVCSKMFTTKYFLKKHKRLHSGEMPYKCNICDKTFTFQQSYHKHRLYHKDDKPHMCATCGRSFKELSTLHNHERIHTGEKPFVCETCGKCFRQRVSYLVHRRIHTGVMPYTCTMCGKSFRYKVSQRTHKCPAQLSNVQQQSNETVQTLSIISDIQEKCNKVNHIQETNSAEVKQVLTGINNEDNKFVLIIDAQGHHVLTRESDLEKISAFNKEQEVDFTEAKEINKSLNNDTWNPDISKNLDPKDSIDSSNKVLPESRNNMQEATDFFSLVMSPLENDLPSPTSGMEHLRVSSPVSKDISQSMYSNFRQSLESINVNMIHTDIEETYTTNDNTRHSFETINEESLKQLLYGMDKK
ncbi:hypothetical protein KPH14_012403 [Odynerus spinipes]|uniref:C2H2-type domain-containing protein n=1 Tax=Odynerus spinipes TaxID=1348599 RepID=A0AAD9VMD5_9HYME|nr:hypothetical protein KPH14_012403 [Odynerus spinipes]